MGWKRTCLFPYLRFIQCGKLFLFDNSFRDDLFSTYLHFVWATNESIQNSELSNHMTQYCCWIIWMFLFCFSKFHSLRFFHRIRFSSHLTFFLTRVYCFQFTILESRLCSDFVESSHTLIAIPFCDSPKLRIKNRNIPNWKPKHDRV